MSLQDDDIQDQLTETLKQTRLSNSSDGEITATNTKADTLITSAEMNSVKNSDEQGEEANTHDKDKNSDEQRIEDSNNKESSSVSFVTPLEATSSSKDSAQTPKLERRKSSLSTTGSRLKRSQSAEKHVTIIDSEATKGDDEQTSEVKAQEEAATKEELSKILMQFDPLVESNQKKADEEETTVTILDRGLFFNDTRSNAKSASISPSLTPSPQIMDSPRSSHDVLVATSEKTKSSSSKKKSESRQRSSQSQDSSRGGDRGSTSSSVSRSEPSKPKDIPFDFHKFLEQMGHRSAIPITRYFRSFLKEFERKPWTVNEQIKIIQDFLDFIAVKMEACDLWKNSTDQEFENVKEGMEKLVMNRLFIHTFSPSTTDDAERDEVLSQKIRIFRWIKEEHLDIPHSPHNDSYLNNAQAELKKINGYKAPRDKVICILNCCKYIFTLIRRSEGNSKGADTFLPILIYVVLRSNPPNLVSNVQYISRFRNPDKLQAEAGYYLASLMGAISFIENLEASSLSISPEEFDQQIGKTMSELNQEKADAVAAETASRTSSPDSQLSGHRKQGSKLATLVAGTAATRGNRQQQQQQQPSINEKQYLTAESAHQEKSPSRSSHSPAGSSILNPATLIERGANFATKTIQKPLDLIEKMFQDSGDYEEMAKPYPPRPSQPQYQQQSANAPPPLPNRNNQQQQQQLQGASNADGNDSFTEFVYVPAGQQVQQLSPQQPNPMHPQQQQQYYQQGYPAEQAAQQQQQPRSQPQYLQELEMLTEMFPKCEREVCRVVLQANDGRISPSIDTLLEMSSINDNSRTQQASQDVNS